MRCPFCQHPDNRVLESRSAEAGQSVRRRRECLQCSRRFTTYERIEYVPVTVVKRNGDRESFDRSKLMYGIDRACEKTGVGIAVIDKIVDDIESELQQRTSREVKSEEIGKLVLERLQAVNEVAYVRFASVYWQFRGIRDFIEVLKDLQHHADSDPSNPSDDLTDKRESSQGSSKSKSAKSDESDSSLSASAPELAPEPTR